MSIPPFATFPPLEVSQELPPAEWGACLDAWISLSELYLRLKDEQFSRTLEDGGSLSKFLITFFKEVATSSNIEANLIPLRKKCFLLVHRIFSGKTIPSSLLHWSFLADLGYAFPRSDKLRTLLSTVCETQSGKIEKGLQTVKASLTRNLDSKNPETSKDDLGKLCHLLYVSPDTGIFMLTGSDFLDSLCAAYTKTQPSIRSKLVTVAYLGLTSLLRAHKPNYSLLSDHLYSLKTNAEQEQKSGSNQSLLADLVTNTPLLTKIRDSITAPEGARAKNIASSLSSFQQSGNARPKKLVKRKIDKGKGLSKDGEYGHGAFGDVHVHRMSLISQIKDLFPDLGSGFVVKLLDEYSDSVEEATAHLLEDSLPPHLKNANRNEDIPAPSKAKPHLTPRSTPPLQPQRRTVFDGDEFDKLTVSASQLHIGRKNVDLTADNLLSDRRTAPNKAAILSALAAFDSDDDERDDTYDVEDVGGTVDSAAPGPDEVDADLRDKNEEALFRAYTATPELFGRDALTRRGKARLALKSETGMTDEAIEGWGIMVGRDPRRLRRLEMKFSAFSGQQAALPSTAYREAGGDGDGSAAEGSGDGRRRGRGGYAGRGRGRGGGRGGRGGSNVTGPSDDKSTQISRQRKEANKGSRANHNRREGRARKMARAGFPG
ncbi:hypothetical protein GQ43DRAFT_395297 [Delitschia confertaspora ATCC 74209]|uniref:CUE domain-containing protein n=1 Tax=Delitschia confertaspora ATCC 74209 TaxID=1513339 RepID=A0A9P4MRZ2_9PLEO|nr:hypothetical protein GQ43DRAFT_395297 [Delitschia confertaspora ATCC 74209]